MMRYVPPYKKYLWLNLTFNFISAFFNVFSIITIIPLLNILFGLSKPVYGIIPMRDAMGGFDELKNALLHNIYSLITRVSETQGNTRALIYIGLFLIIMVFFKVGFTYLANYFIVFVRNFVVRDIRNQIYEKTVSLPIGFFTEEHKGDIILPVSCRK
jgi:ABC-type multidrug transport system fused ATPase/permease subunit